MKEPLGHLLHQASRRSELVHALAFPITCSRAGRNGNSCAVKKSPRAAPAGSARPSHGVGAGAGRSVWENPALPTRINTRDDHPLHGPPRGAH